MEENTDIPLPIRFNPFKHHLGYLFTQLENMPPEEFAALWDPVCNNYIDLYTGMLTPAEIARAIIKELQSRQAFMPGDFARWLTLKIGYQQIELSDQSQWIVRQGEDPERYIHIHPARTGQFTIRFKGSTLKTVCLIRASQKTRMNEPTLNFVNQIRLKNGLSPIKKLEPCKGILKCYALFFGRFE
ncbi:MAG: hypothetical protein AB7U05_03190 [Mangrovibacterium sp.]